MNQQYIFNKASLNSYTRTRLCMDRSMEMFWPKAQRNRILYFLQEQWFSICSIFTEHNYSWALNSTGFELHRSTCVWSFSVDAHGTTWFSVGWIWGCGTLDPEGWLWSYSQMFWLHRGSVPLNACDIQGQTVQGETRLTVTSSFLQTLRDFTYNFQCQFHSTNGHLLSARHWWYSKNKASPVSHQAHGVVWGGEERELKW